MGVYGGLGNKRVKMAEMYSVAMLRGLRRLTGGTGGFSLSVWLEQMLALVLHCMWHELSHQCLKANTFNGLQVVILHPLLMVLYGQKNQPVVCLFMVQNTLQSKTPDLFFLTVSNPFCVPLSDLPPVYVFVSCPEHWSKVEDYYDGGQEMNLQCVFMVDQHLRNFKNNFDNDCSSYNYCKSFPFFFFL